jgi:protein-S-isoprenylcysteine O-methyltransferase Ste14
VLAATTTGAPPALRLLFIATAIGWLVAELRQSANHRPEATPADGGSRPILRITTIVGAVAALVLTKAVPAAAIGDRALAAALGLIVLWAGIALRLWSFHTLGRYFTFTVQTSDDQPVITAGPYRWIRHPSYAGVLVAVIGIGLFLGNWLALAALVGCAAVGLVNRIRIEERALLTELGEPYRQYAATHKRLVPYLW